MRKGHNYCLIETSLLQFLHWNACRLKFYSSLAIKDEETVRSPASLEKAANHDEKTSTEMELYEEDDDVDDMDEEVTLEDEKALSGKHMHMKLIHHNWLNCVLLNLISIRCFYLAIKQASRAHTYFFTLLRWP